MKRSGSGVHISELAFEYTEDILNTDFLVVSEMTYTVSSGTLNSTIPYHTIPDFLLCLIIVQMYTLTVIYLYGCL